MTKPHVALIIHQALVVTQAGKAKVEAVPKAGAKRGQVLRYTIIAKNTGAAPAFDLAPLGKVPANTVFVAGSAAPRTAVEYSLDGHAFSPKPMKKIVAANGKVTYVPADPATYVAVQWHNAHPLKAHATQLFSYEVRIK
ncbi:MAG TPA: hypothetical protein VNF68_05275 [Candidatus Baltobacteraceae bacterium]|nr:hypothetical protein [Candidatus Baltobacteraceae bacterium]